ncbi:alpha/beta fold hydrolase [Arenibaculum pallidiluteum]|uniref:alpha/beta fold hydrolase n=1 Tax=Arenibaculum pallidiluteum TaxID=2812559 RepID=UPI001A979B24|nr:alpha/beta hydrolase [Arenibaculum pallidiluteum]
MTGQGASLFYRDWGAGDPILFLAGWTLSSDMWAYQMEPLSRQGFRCAAYDRRAHGRSSDPGRGYDYDTLADDLADVIEALRLENLTLVAHSFASGEVVRYLTRHGSARIARVALIAPAAIPFLLRTDDNPIGVPEAAFAQMRDAFLSDFAGWAEDNAEPYFVPGTSRATADWTIRMMTQTSLQAAGELNRIQVSTDFRSELARLDVPVLILHGDRDASAPIEITGRPAAALIPGARLMVYEGAPHGLYFTHKERLNQDLTHFIREQA